MDLKCKLSSLADKDLEDIFDYTYSEHGLDQAIEYVSSFDEVFVQLTQYPEIGRPRDEIRKELRSLVHKHHILFYRVLEDHIRIVRILHGSRDIPSQFKYMQ